MASKEYYNIGGNSYPMRCLGNHHVTGHYQVLQPATLFWFVFSLPGVACTFHACLMCVVGGLVESNQCYCNTTSRSRHDVHGIRFLKYRLL